MICRSIGFGAGLLLVTACFTGLRSEEILTGWATELHTTFPSVPKPKSKTADVRPTSKKMPLKKGTSFTPPVKDDAPVQDHAVDGIASYYWQDLYTASGEIFDKNAMTAAHPTLPFGTLVEVTNLGNGRSALVRINDRGPFIPGRVIDVSEAAAIALGMRLSGLAPVRINIVTASADVQQSNN